ncbi:DNA polymerase III subunit delta [Fructilactobacillus lindneri]|uniref:DNA polymerase III subunit delta n=1 Tax=Fructilactobacillus lindneri DSM 20690 = JCM 11027 TaxID=1122148 RepID=A0A0R2JYU4_9LACO|nr:DNA polymerase III subunit delta [Fructilactobacillus lindneri]KRN80662.1 hypothetical protein IV52_GL001218 [Fructilactobacillus lindneri DSM 20690 = JCM 11027]POH07516.1 DNA polymerase III subunit delta [Fructilactobacillus lindneri]POH08385.1 DNA polymerase III subunit delta [Fructilactobacillus lindneri]POH24897.1 DNA polymerase III subunit delta [Fructilactobacillus lindneri DSM 20690 = JCM 11027]SKA00865.1 DNA polymerase III, delta subunit [Fructilactobacillus lindneri DSM 20690 = JCM
MSIVDEVESISKNPSSVYLVVGGNDYWENQIINQLKEIIPQEERTMNFATYDMDDVPLSEAINDASSMPFFGNRRVVIIKNAFFLTGMRNKSKIKHNINELERYLDNISNNTVLLIFAPYSKLDGRKKITKKLKKNSTVINLNDFSEREIINFVKQYIDNKHYQISNDALNELFSRTQGDLSKMINELNKVMIYSNKEKKIDLNIVDLLVAKSINQNVFSLVNYLMKGKTTQAIQFYHELLEQKQDSIKINAILESQFRLLLQVKILKDHGYSATMIAKSLKIHPYRVKLAYQSVESFTVDYLQAAYLELVQIECKLKSSQENPELLFEMFSIKFSQKKNSI